MQFSEELSSFYHNMIALNLTLAVIPERRTYTKKHIEVGILAVPRLTTHLPLKRQPDMRAVPMAIAIISKAPSKSYGDYTIEEATTSSESLHYLRDGTNNLRRSPM
jgi:hypothetical protein